MIQINPNVNESIIIQSRLPARIQIRINLIAHTHKQAYHLHKPIALIIPINIYK